MLFGFVCDVPREAFRGKRDVETCNERERYDICKYILIC